MAGLKKRKGLILTGAVLAAGMAVACGGGSSSDTGEATKGDAVAAADPKADGVKSDGPEGVYKFGQSVKFRDGSTLTVGKPVKFTRDKYAAGGDKQPVSVKLKATFKNNTKEVFDPALTTAAVSAEGEEGESIYQEGLDAPDNKVLPGKSVTWWMGYGVRSQKDLQLEVTVGFLDYGTVIFTN
jgi:hypothetical protein